MRKDRRICVVELISMLGSELDGDVGVLRRQDSVLEAEILELSGLFPLDFPVDVHSEVEGLGEMMGERLGEP